MKKISTSLVLLLFGVVAYSQEAGKQLNEAEKEALRKNHNSGLTFTKESKSAISNVNVTESKEEAEKDVKTTIVKYYYGKEDTLYKNFKYKETD